MKLELKREEVFDRMWMAIVVETVRVLLDVPHQENNAKEYDFMRDVYDNLPNEFKTQEGRDRIIKVAERYVKR